MSSPKLQVDKCLVVLPTYNEAENIENVVSRVHSVVTCDILIVDDGSTDGTIEIIKRLNSKNPKVFLSLRKSKNGLGDAYRHAYTWAIENGYELLIQCDADGSHEIEKIPDMYEKYLSGSDLVVGSRYVPGGNVEGWSSSRILISKMGNLYAKLVLRLPVKDLTAGYRLYRISTLRNINYLSAVAKGYSFQIQMSYLFRNHKISEVPITFVDRVFGASKMNTKIALEAIWQIPFIRYNSK